MTIKTLLLPVLFVAGATLGLAPSANAGHGDDSLYRPGGDHDHYGLAYRHDEYRHGHRGYSCSNRDYPRHYRGHRHGYWKKPWRHYRKHKAHYRDRHAGHNGEDRYRGNHGVSYRHSGHGGDHKSHSGR